MWFQLDWISARSDEKETVATWMKWKWEWCHLDEMKVKVMSPGWGGSWLISSDGTVQPNSCSFLSWFYVKLCWPMTIVSGGEGRHAMCFFFTKTKELHSPMWILLSQAFAVTYDIITLWVRFWIWNHFWTFHCSASTIKMYSWYWFGGAVQFLAFKIWTCQCW